MSMITFLIAVFGVQGLAQWYKNIQTHYTDTQIHAAVGVLSIVASLVFFLFGKNETFLMLLKNAGIIFVSALAIYQTIWKQLGKFLNS